MKTDSNIACTSREKPSRAAESLPHKVESVANYKFCLRGKLSMLQPQYLFGMKFCHQLRRTSQLLRGQVKGQPVSTCGKLREKRRTSDGSSLLFPTIHGACMNSLDEFLHVQWMHTRREISKRPYSAIQISATKEMFRSYYRRKM